MSIIAIAPTRGSEGVAIGEAAARALEYRFIDREIIRKAARGRAPPLVAWALRPQPARQHPPGRTGPQPHLQQALACQLWPNRPAALPSSGRDRGTGPRRAAR